MIYPELLEIRSAQLAPPELPDDPRSCAVPFQVVVGSDEEDEEPFGFTVVTPSWLARSSSPTWGRGYLVVREFDWDEIARSLALLLARAARPTWDEVVQELEKDLRRDFDAGAVAEA